MIVVTTPTGQIGGRLLPRLVETGRPVRVVVRDPARLPDDLRERVEVFRGSLDDRAVLAEAYAGADSVFYLTPPDWRAASINESYLAFGRATADAVAEQGVKRVVGVSTLGRGVPGQGAGHLSAAVLVDEAIEATGTHYRSLRNPFFMENLLRQIPAIKDQGVIALPSEPTRVLPLVATDSIARVAASLLLDDTWTGQNGVAVVSPDAYTPVDVARVVGEVLERPIEFRHIPPKEYGEMMLRHGASEGVAQAMVEMARAQNEGFYDTEPATSERADSIGLREWCEQVLRPAVLAD